MLPLSKRLSCKASLHASAGWLMALIISRIPRHSSAAVPIAGAQMLRVSRSQFGRSHTSLMGVTGIV